ncbi:hypothetical protein E1A91_A03G051000v1 [Gossypium mustelinum]|uniref:Uncharacterized protein n=1 Tax=Gossypium mustelinum TaxID=34275 RepID=A0A5D2ZUQ5_GOSMU|nr:hypothetical protein E1A91_A03G051000v1 [Gossypium mustelinum]
MVRILLNSSLLPTRSTFSYSARTSSCDSKSSKAYNSEQIQLILKNNTLF